MGWMVHSKLIPFFVWLGGFEGWDGMCFNLLSYLLVVG
jgi:hypothetical protein